MSSPSPTKPAINTQYDSGESSVRFAYLIFQWHDFIIISDNSKMKEVEKFIYNWYVEYVVVHCTGYELCNLVIHKIRGEGGMVIFLHC